ncbi:MAG: hypothetical protein K5905_23895 [Roseibium sp.]|uniref:helix-turn-helix transcriptional regulator n=1 Tax=Roseibium sp. TaxID=1936156 RepID=UPI002625CB42|nr:hypothetical protein [Roseibium sp.]MCV0428512.1 hypothetical protein [Roseibium sp.]
MIDFSENGRAAFCRLFVLAVAGFYLCLDLYEEFFLKETEPQTGLMAYHHWIEIIVVALVIWLIWLEVRAARELRDKLAEQKAVNLRLSDGVANRISAKFTDWGLTAAESEVAWLLIKGFSFIEISELRQVKSKTLRQQASSVYAKAAVGGRSELTAVFLEELLGDEMRSSSTVSG